MQRQFIINVQLQRTACIAESVTSTRGTFDLVNCCSLLQRDMTVLSLPLDRIMC